MNAQQALTPQVVPQAQATQLSTLDLIKPLLNEHGEIDLQSLQIPQRVAVFQEFSAAANCNLPLWETTLLSIMPPGVSFVPLVIIPGPLDAWRDDDARKMKLKDGHVEPSADFMQKIANLLDIKLVKVFDGVREETGSKMYSVRYNAFLTLPNGETLTVTDEGKDQELFTANGKQAHVIESTRKKAKRNAIKAILGVPTSMPKEHFDRPWVLLRPVFKPGQSIETDEIIANQKALADESKKLLFPVKVAEMKQEEGDFEVLSAAIEQANNAQDLELVAKRINSVALTGEVRAHLGGLFKQRKAALEGPPPAPIPPTPMPTPQEPIAAEANGGY